MGTYCILKIVVEKRSKMASSKTATGGHFDVPTRCDNCMRKGRKIVMDENDEVKTDSSP